MQTQTYKQEIYRRGIQTGGVQIPVPANWGAAAKGKTGKRKKPDNFVYGKKY
mgnify:CR=1 FL=1